MDTKILLLAVIALAGLGVMMLGFNSEVTGQGVKMIKLPAETNKAFVEAVGKGSQPPASNPDTCNCYGLFGGHVATVTSVEGGEFVAGMSAFDCILIAEIIKLRKELKLDTTSADQFEAFCKAIGW